jgi:hypothetical protein
MAKLNLKKGATSQLIEFFVPNSSVSTGAGLTGLVFNSGSLTGYYYRSGAASATAITLVTMTVGTWASGGFKEVDATNMPGIYQLGVPDAALATAAKSVVIMLKGATNMSPVALEIQLVKMDPENYAVLDAVTHTGAVIPTVTAVTNDVGITQAGADKAWSTAARALTAGVTVTTNNDKTAYALTSGERDSIADALLDRDMSVGTITAARRSPRRALRLLANKWSISGSTMTVYDEVDTTPAYTIALTTTPGADPVSAADPS